MKGMKLRTAKGRQASQELEEDFYELTHHEDELINQRLTWLLTSQALLFAGYAVLVTKDKEKDKGLMAPEQFQAVLDWLPRLGMTISALILIGIIGAIIASLMLVKRYERPHPGVSWVTTIFGWIPAVLFPIVFIVVWLLL